MKKNIFLKSYLYVSPMVLLCALFFSLKAAQPGTVGEAGLLLSVLLSGTLGGFIHIIIWERDKKVCLTYRPWIAMAFSLITYCLLYGFLSDFRERFPTLTPVGIAAIGFFTALFSKWILQWLFTIFSEILSTEEKIKRP